MNRVNKFIIKNIKNQKSKVVFFLIITACFLASCENEQLISPDFDVIATVRKDSIYNDAGTEKLNVYQVSFVFTGNPKNIVFYSGENGSEYRYRNRTHRMVTPYVKFSAAYNGDIPNSLRVMVSNDFKPEYEYYQGRENRTLYTRAGVEAATWTDITNRFNLPGNQLTAGTHTSGEAMISEFHQEYPLFIAFRFDADRSSDPSLSIGTWEFSLFNIRNELYEGNSALYINNELNNNWRTVNLADPTTFNVDVNTNEITLNGNQYAITGIDEEGNEVVDEEGNEVVETFYTSTVKTMLISRPFYPSRVDNDKGMVVKGMDERVAVFTYEYVEPQVESVHVAFVATNSLFGEDIQEVKQMEIVFE